VGAAAKIDAHERADTRRKFFRELGRYVFRTVVLGAAFAAAGQEDADRHPTTIGIIGVIATVALFMTFLIRSMMHPDEDATERRAANDVPSWVGVVGPIVFLVLLSKYGHC
jgi:hypothetical protein